MEQYYELIIAAKKKHSNTALFHHENALSRVVAAHVVIGSI